MANKVRRLSVAPVLVGVLMLSTPFTEVCIADGRGEIFEDPTTTIEEYLNGNAGEILANSSIYTFGDSAVIVDRHFGALFASGKNELATPSNWAVADLLHDPNGFYSIYISDSRKRIVSGHHEFLEVVYWTMCMGTQYQRSVEYYALYKWNSESRFLEHVTDVWSRDSRRACLDEGFPVMSSVETVIKLREDGSPHTYMVRVFGRTEDGQGWLDEATESGTYSDEGFSEKYLP